MRKQRGVTMIGWLFLLAPVAVVLYAVIRVGPEYLNYYKVVQALKETASQLKSDETLSPASIRGAVVLASLTLRPTGLCNERDAVVDAVAAARGTPTLARAGGLLPAGGHRQRDGADRDGEGPAWREHGHPAARRHPAGDRRGGAQPARLQLEPDPGAALGRGADHVPRLHQPARWLQRRADPLARLVRPLPGQLPRHGRGRADQRDRQAPWQRG